MNREIEFKFVIDGKYVTKSYTLSEILEKGIDEQKILEDAESGCDGNASCQVNGFCECSLEFENSGITQKIEYTGLKDKNGVKNFDFDIIEIDFGKGIVNGYIFWDNELACFSFNSFDKIYLNYRFMKYPFLIIGNIFKNPELIKK